jgi:Tfp pilus assembly protein PilF
MLAAPIVMVGCAAPSGADSGNSLWERMAWKSQTSAAPTMGPSTTPPTRIAEAPSPSKIKNPAKLNLAYGRWQEQAGQFPEARRSYDKVLKDDPKSVDAILGLARLDQLAGRTREAETGFERAVKLKPNDPHALAAIGEFYASQERWPDAIRSFEASLSMAQADLTNNKPANVTTEYHLALAKARSGDIPGSLPHFKKSIGEAEGHYNVGHILYEKGQMVAAAKEFEHALRLRPDLLEAQARLDEIRGSNTGMQLASGMNGPASAVRNAAGVNPGKPPAASQHSRPESLRPTPPFGAGISGAQVATPVQRSIPPDAVNLSAPKPASSFPAPTSVPVDTSRMTPQQLEQWRNQFGSGTLNP